LIFFELAVHLWMQVARQMAATPKDRLFRGNSTPYSAPREAVRLSLTLHLWKPYGKPAWEYICKLQCKIARTAQKPEIQTDLSGYTFIADRESGRCHRSRAARLSAG
jgi:hypothetical protein